MVQTRADIGRELFYIALDTPILDAYDCNEDGAVGFDDLQIVIRLSLGEDAEWGCFTSDRNDDGVIGVEDAVGLVHRLAQGSRGGS